MKNINYAPIPLYGDVEWDICSEAIHMLLLAPSGSGKTVFLNYLSGMTLKRGHQLYVIDGKNTSFGALFKSIGCEVASSADEVVELLTKLVAEMESDYQEFFSSEFIAMSDNFSDMNLPAKVLIFDEVLSVIDSGSKDDKNEMIRLLKQIALKGRAVGLSLVISSQRLLASDLPKAITEQCMVKVILGSSISEELFHLVTGLYKKDIGTTYNGGVGKGYAVTPKTGLTYFETPYMPPEVTPSIFKNMLIEFKEGGGCYGKHN